MRRRLAVCLLTLAALSACRSTPTESTLFKSIRSTQSGIDFANTIQENDTLNILTYQYLYNGGGIAIGDLNNDGLADVYFSGNMVPNKLYLNEGNLHFRDVTKQAGVAGRTKWKTGVSMADVNGDGRLDIYVCYSGPGTPDQRRNELYINQGVQNGVPIFTEQARQYGIDAPGTFSTQATFFDMDHDNDLDLFLVNHADMFFNAFYNTAKLRSARHPAFGNRLYRNDGRNGSSPRFTDVSAEAGIDGSGLNFGLSASIGDVNNDGWPDIYVTNDYNEQDFLYLNQHNGHFSEVLKKAIGYISKFSMGSNIADLNNDLNADIVTLDMLPEDNHRQKLLKGPDEYDTYQLLVANGFHHQNMRNMLQLNQGISPDGIPQFSEVGQLAGMSNTDWSWSPLVGDFDNDGRKDLYVTNGYLRDFTNMDFLKYTYQDAEQKARASGKPLNTWQVVQQMPSTKTSNYCFANQSANGSVSFQDVTRNWGLSIPSISTGVAYADLDNDGDLDIVVNNSNDPAMLYENRSNVTNQHHYVTLRLRPKQGQNPQGIGAKVILKTGEGTQMQELYPASSFQSSNNPELHFGLGRDSRIQSLQILWPDGGQSTLTNLKGDTTLVITDEKKIETPPISQSAKQEVWFTDYTTASKVNYTHQATPFVDFKQQSLLPYQLSKVGPFMAQGDVDGNVLPDVFVGGNSRRSGELLMQHSDGTFTKNPVQPWANPGMADDMGSVFFDADKDGDQDLLIVRGGVEWETHSSVYQDQLYLNNGKGVFSKTSNALPDLTANGSCVAVADYDHDGDLDVFIGGRSVPGRFPEADFSYLLRNESSPGKPRFVYASEQADQTLRHPGLVTSAIWTDLNRDGWLDLVVAGEEMPITLYENQRGKLVNTTRQHGLPQTSGLWQKIVATDLDNDGDMDLIGGNMGLNTQLKASEKEALSLCYGDFDKNGTVDPLLCYFIQGKSYPLASLDELAGHFPSVRKKFVNYASYAEATLDQILTPEQLKSAKTLTVNTLASTYFEQQPNGTFKAYALPFAAQVSCVSGIVVQDIDKDGHKDLILGGNFYPWRVQLGRSDASFGSLLRGNGRGGFSTIPNAQTGLSLTGDIRDLLSLTSKRGYPYLFYTRQNDKMGVSILKK